MSTIRSITDHPGSVSGILRRLQANSGPLAWLFLAGFAFLVPILGFLTPAVNWDGLAYDGIVQSWTITQKSAVQHAAYADMKAFAVDHGNLAEYQQLISPTDYYRHTVATDPVAFWQQLPDYRVRWLYLAVVFLLSKFTPTVAQAMRLISACMVLGTNLAFAIMVVRRFGLLGAILPVAVFSLAPFMTGIAHTLSPDAMITFLVAIGFALLLCGWEFFGSIVLLTGILVRTDIALLDLTIALVIGVAAYFHQELRSRKTVALTAIMALSLPIERAVDYLAGSYGYKVIYHVSFFGYDPYPANLDPSKLVLNPWQMMHFLVEGVHLALARGTLWILLGMALVLGACLRSRWFTLPSLLFVALMLYLGERLVLFPEVDTRYFSPVFVAFGLLLLEVWPLRQQTLPGSRPGMAG